MAPSLKIGFPCFRFALGSLTGGRWVTFISAGIKSLCSNCAPGTRGKTVSISRLRLGDAREILTFDRGGDDIRKLCRERHA